MDKMRIDHRMICEMIETGSKVLDLGCGDGELLRLIAEKRQAKVQGIELSEEAIYQCVEKGVSVFHGNMEAGLIGYPDKSFDYVILNQSMQETKNIDFVIQEALRVGDKAIIGIPNFAHMAARCRLFFRGKAPVTRALPHRWYSTPNLHFASLTDFMEFCSEKELTILKKRYLGSGHEVRLFPNLFALNGIFMITKKSAD